MQADLDQDRLWNLAGVDPDYTERILVEKAGVYE